MEHTDHRWLRWAIISLLLLMGVLMAAFLAFWYVAWPISPGWVIRTSPWTEPQLRAWAKLELNHFQYWAGTPTSGMAMKIKQSFVVRQDEAEGAFLKCLNSPNPSLRRATLNLSVVVASAGMSPSVEAAILAAVDDTDADVRVAACWATGVLPSEIVKPVLKRLLTSSDSEVRKGAIEILGYGGDREVATWIMPLLRDPDPRIRQVTIQALATIGDPSTISAVEALVADTDARVAASVAEFLKTMKATTVPGIVR